MEGRAIITLLAHNDGKRGYLAADRRVRAGSEIVSDSATKVYRAGPWLIGWAGSSIAGNLLDVNAALLGKADSAWTFCLALREVFRLHGWSPEALEKGSAPQIDSSFLLVGEMGCYSVFSNFSPQKQDRPCCAGSGGAFAAGALSALLYSASGSASVAEMMHHAVRVACRFDLYSGGEPQVEITHRTGVKGEAENDKPWPEAPLTSNLGPALDYEEPAEVRQ